MSSSQELHIGKVSKPVFKSSVTNDITYGEGLISQIYEMPKPWTDGAGPGVPRTFTIWPWTAAEPYFNGFVYALGSTPPMARDSIYYKGTDYEIAGDIFGWALKVSDYSDPRSKWTIYVPGGVELITAQYGLLPSNYSSRFYELVEIKKLRMTVNSVSSLLYKNAGNITVHGTATIGTFNDVRAPIYYDVILKQKFDPYELITVDGYSSTYTVNQPIGSATAVFYTDWRRFDEYHYPAPTGDTRYPITMTETPEN